MDAPGRGGRARRSRLLLALLPAAALACATAGERPDQGGAVHVVPVTGTIELGLAPFVSRALSEAAAADAAAVVLDIDTPGGRVDAAWEIIDAVRDSPVPVHAFVNRRALSAGAMIALSARGLWMRPGSTLGAATPVTGAGEKAPEKMVSAMRSEFRALAEERGFDPRLAEAMVDEAVEIKGVVEAGRLLTLTTEEAVRLGVASGEVEDFGVLLSGLGLAGAPLVEASPNWAEAVVRFLTHPLFAPLLLSLGFLGLMVEIKTPTFGVAGAVGLLCLAAFFGARVLVNLAGWEELILLSVGVILVLAEIVLIPGFGVAGALGGLAILSSAVLSMVGRFATVSDVVQAIGWVSLSLLAVGAMGFAILRHIPRSRSGFSGIILKGSTSRETGYLSAPERTDLIGKIGVALTDLRPSGTAQFGDERVDVVTEGPWIGQGAKVVVLRAEGYRHLVREVPAMPPGPAREEAPETRGEKADGERGP